jgi:glyoxylase-like metal-dependent hydrolase (beta-lactamase superfamily II)
MRALLLLFAPVLCFAAAPRDRMKVPDLVPPLDLKEVAVLPVRDNIYMLTTAAGNLTVQVGPDGVLIVDSGDGSMTPQVVAAIRGITQRPIHYIVNTSAEAEQIGGNADLARAGSPPGFPEGDPQIAHIIAHENAANRMLRPTGKQLEIDQAGWPLVTYFVPSFDLFFNGTPVELVHVPAARSDGDSLVVFRRTDVVAAGDIFATDRYPVIDPERGGSLNGTIDALNRLIDITVPELLQEGGTLVVPGHGRLSDEGDVVEYRDMLSIVRERLRALIAQGKSLEEVQGAKPTLDYDGTYGSTTGPWTTAMFIAAAYRELQSERRP